MNVSHPVFAFLSLTLTLSHPLPIKSVNKSSGDDFFKNALVDDSHQHPLNAFMSKLNHSYETYVPLANRGLSIFGDVADFCDAVGFDSERCMWRSES